MDNRLVGASNYGRSGKEFVPPPRHEPSSGRVVSPAEQPSISRKPEDDRLQNPVLSPSPAYVRKSQMTAFAERVRGTLGLNFAPHYVSCRYPSWMI
jgi:hypothetical protein